MIVKGNRRRFSSEVELELFRVAQEAFSNIRKHAQASEMNAIVEFGEGKTTVTISDNGKGFDAGDNLTNLPRTGKLGLAGMEERVRLLGGTLSNNLLLTPICHSSPHISRLFHPPRSVASSSTTSTICQ